jgi:hypothetical protein
MIHHLHHLHLHLHLHHSTPNRHYQPLLAGRKQGVTREDLATSNNKKGDDIPTATTTKWTNKWWKANTGTGYKAWPK